MNAVSRALFLGALMLLWCAPSVSAQVRPPPSRAIIAPSGDQAGDETVADEDEAVDEEDDAADEPPPLQAVRPPARGAQRAPGQLRLQPGIVRPPGMPASPAEAARPQPARPQPAARPPASDGIPDIEDLAATRERPLFSSTRRPPEPVEEPAGPAPIAEGAPMPFELVGVVIGDDVSAAIFRNTASKEETRVTKGDKIGRWSLEEVAARAVVLHGGDKRVRMHLFDESKTPGVNVSRVSGEPDESEAPPPGESEEKVDEDIAPSSSPQVKPATAQPKPPPSVRQQEQMRRRLNRAPPRGNQRRYNNNARQ